MLEEYGGSPSGFLSLCLATDYAVQVFGAIGFMDECPVSRYYRDVRPATIADGTTQIQKHIIARELGCFR